MNIFQQAIEQMVRKAQFQQATESFPPSERGPRFASDEASVAADLGIQASDMPALRAAFRTAHRAATMNLPYADDAVAHANERIMAAGGLANVADDERGDAGAFLRWKAPRYSVDERRAFYLSFR